MRNPEYYYTQQGWESARSYKRLEDNPYSKGFAQHNWWAEGFMAYKAERSIPLEQRIAS